MTVALAFKAFAKAIPCLTPFLATSDPSVLMRILAYIRGLPCSLKIFSQKSDPYLYGPIVAVRLRANLEAHSWTNERPGDGTWPNIDVTATRAAFRAHACRRSTAPFSVPAVGGRVAIVFYFLREQSDRISRSTGEEHINPSASAAAAPARLRRPEARARGPRPRHDQRKTRP